MAIVHSYLRFSSDKQADGNSTERQESFAIEFCAKHNHQLSNLKLDDKGKSGYKGDKQVALKLFLSELGKRVQPGDILFVEAIDRLGRKGVRATQDVVNKILNAGIDIAIKLPVEKIYKASDDNDIGGAIELAAFAYQAHIYSQNLSQRISSSWESRRRKLYEGQIIKGKIPCWLRIVNGKFEIIPYAAEVIQYIYKRTIDGIGNKLLMRELNTQFKPIARGRYNAAFIQKLVRQRLVRGEYQPHTIVDGVRKPIGDLIPNYYPEIITEELWQQSRMAMENRRIEKGPTGLYINLFAGIVRYGWDDCNAIIYTYAQTRSDGRKVIYRRLKSYAAQVRTIGHHTETVECGLFEKAILQHLVEVDTAIFNDDKDKIILKKNEKRLKDINRQVSAIQEAIKSVPDVLALLKPLQELQTEATELDRIVRQQNNALLGNPQQTLQKLHSIDLTKEENRYRLREAIKQVIRQITIYPVKMGNERRSSICCLAIIDFIGGHQKRILITGKDSVTYTDHSSDTNHIPTYDELRQSIKDTITRLNALGLH